MDERWGIAANVRAPGTKHFVTGTKVYMAGMLWGDGGERVYVYGRHRGGGRYIKVIVASKTLENFRPVLWQGHKVERADLDRALFPTKEEAAVSAAAWTASQAAQASA